MPPTKSRDALDRLLVEGVVHGDAEAWLPCLSRGVVDLFFTSPPYADARAYSRIHPDRYVEWFLPFVRAMYDATAETGSLIINIKNRVANRGPLKGQRHPYVYELVLALQHMGWRWIETYIWPSQTLCRAGSAHGLRTASSTSTTSLVGPSRTST